MEDINQHFEQLRRLLVKIGYPHSVDKERICAGITTELLPLLHYGLLSHSKCLSSFISDAGYSLYRQNDLKFTEGIYKLLRKEFKHNPILQCQQFLTDKGFAKRKIQFVVTCLKLGIAKHNELIKQKKLSSQAKISWKQTNLAKKIEKLNAENKNNNNQNNNNNNIHKKPPKIIKKKIVIKSVKAINNKPGKPPKSIIPKKITIENPIDDTEEDEEEDDDDDDDDEIEIENKNGNNMNDDSLTVDEIRNNLPKPITINPPNNQNFANQEDEESEDENKENEEEEKAMELKEEQEETNQSIQIPQYKYDMQLIPEYDPEKYANQQIEKVEVVKNVQDNERDDVMRTNEHYSESYLDGYSDLMDIPYDDDDNDENNENGGNDDIDNDNSEKEESKHRVIVLSNVTKNAVTVQAGDTDDGEQYEQDQIEDEHEVEINDCNNNKDKDKDDNNSLLSFMKQMDKKFEIFSKDLKAHIDDKCFLLEKRIETLERTNTKFEEKIKSQQERIEALENNADKNNTNNTRSRTSSGFTIPSKPVISTKSNEEKSNEDLPSNKPPSTSRITSSLTSKQPYAYKSVLSPTSFPGNTSFTDSTIGSSALGMSISPNLTKTNSALLNGNGNGNGLSMTQPRIGMTTNNRNIISGQLRTAQSPFIGSQSYNYNAYQPSQLSQPSMTHLTGMSSMSMNNGIMSGGGNNLDVRSDPNNTMEFIADLKRMLNSTDALLKSNREERKGLGLYDANI